MIAARGASPPWRLHLAAVVLSATVCLGVAGWAQAQVFPWGAADATPPISGVRLGDSRAQLDGALGMADDVQDLAPGSFALYFKERGVIVLYSTHEGVTAIYLLSPTAGDVDGLRVGDSREQVLAKWGLPSKTIGAKAIYRGRGWVTELELGPQQAIVRIGVGRPDEHTGELP